MEECGRFTCSHNQGIYEVPSYKLVILVIISNVLVLVRKTRERRTLNKTKSKLKLWGSWDNLKRHYMV